MMMRKIILCTLLLALMQTIWAVSWTPSFDISSGITFNKSLTLDDERLFMRTSFPTRLEFSPLAVTLADRHRLSAGFRGTIMSDSLLHSHTTLLGSSRLSVFLDYEFSLNRMFFAFEAGIGLGRINRQDITFAFLDTELTAGIYIEEYVRVSTGISILYRREILEGSIIISLSFILPEGIAGGKR